MNWYDFEYRFVNDGFHVHCGTLENRNRFFDYMKSKGYFPGFDETDHFYDKYYEYVYYTEEGIHACGGVGSEEYTVDFYDLEFLNEPDPEPLTITGDFSVEELLSLPT